MLDNPTRNCTSYVAARKAAEDIASVETLLCSALRFAFAVDFSQTNHCKNNINSDSI